MLQNHYRFVSLIYVSVSNCVYIAERLYMILKWNDERFFFILDTCLLQNQLSMVKKEKKPLQKLLNNHLQILYDIKIYFKNPF